MSKQDPMADLMSAQSAQNTRARERGTLPQSSDGRNVWFTPDQWSTVERAVAALRLGQEDPTIPESRALELICADALAGAT